MASELINVLRDIIAEHGDLPVVTKDPDTGWRLEIGVVYRDSNNIEGYPRRIEIRSSYHDRPKGSSALPNV